MATRTLVSWFVPESVSKSEEGPRARLGVGISLFMVVVFAVLATTHAVARSVNEAYANVGLALLMLMGPGVVRLTGRYKTATHLTLGFVLVVIAYIGGTVRGAGVNAATVALAEIPLFATLLVGPRVGLVWVSLSCAASALIGVAGHRGWIQNQVPERARLFDDHVVLVVITLTLYLVAVLYERGRAQGLLHIAALDAERRRAELEKLAAQTEARLANAERMASLGRVAAVAAHEINNPLSYVSNNVEYVLRLPDLGGRRDVTSALTDALEGIRRIQRTVDDLKAFARQEEAPPVAGDEEASIHPALELAEVNTGGKAGMETELSDVPAAVESEPRLAARGKILIVDDEPLVARALGRHLSRHDVRTVQSGRQALDLLDRGEQFDLIFCDLMMPGFSGMDVYEAINERHQHMVKRLVFMTGGTVTSASREFRARATQEFLQKPLDLTRLNALVTERLREER